MYIGGGDMQEVKKKNSLFIKDKVTYLPLRLIAPNPNQPRRRFEPGELAGLAESIRENGVLQPITVRLIGRAYFLVAGERRLRAAHIAGLTEIPCLIICADERKSALLALLENLQRENLNFFEEAAGIDELIRTCGFSQDDIAKKLGRSQSAVSNKLRLLRLGHEVIEAVVEAGLSERHARALLRLSSYDERLAAVRKISGENMNVSQTDEYIERLLVEKDRKEHLPEKPTRQYVIKDVRLFINTVNRAIGTMQKAGVKTDIERTESDDAILMSIKIFK